jgi:hypothetical protein
MSQNFDSNFVYVVNNDSAPAIGNMIRDLNTKSNDLEVKYIETIKRMQDSIQNYQLDDQRLDNIYNEHKKIKNENEYAQLVENNRKQNDMINNLASSLSTINQIQNKIFDNTPNTINNIRSFKGQNLVVTPVKDNYLININNNCLNVDSDNKYSLKPCNDQSPQQLFKINTISDETSFYKHYGSNPTEQDLTEFPFSVIKSNINNYCLSDNNGTGVSMNQCTNMEGQKWRGMKRDNVSCIQ